MHPTGPKYTEYRQTHTLDGATAVAREVVLRLSLFAVTTLLGREPAFMGAGPRLKLVSSAVKGSTPMGGWSLRVS